MADKIYIEPLTLETVKRIIEKEKPDYILPEIEAIATDTLVELEKEGFSVMPSAVAAKLTMNREGIRRLASETLELPTSPYKFASTFDEFKDSVKQIGIPCVVNRMGIQRIVELPLGGEEKQRLHSSCEMLENTYQEI